MGDTKAKTQKRKRLTDEERKAKMLAAIREIDARAKKKAQKQRMEYIQILALIGAGWLHSNMTGAKDMPIRCYLSGAELEIFNELCNKIYGKKYNPPKIYDKELPEDLRFVAFRRRRKQKKATQMKSPQGGSTDNKTKTTTGGWEEMMSKPPQGGSTDNKTKTTTDGWEEMMSKPPQGGSAG